MWQFRDALFDDNGNICGMDREFSVYKHYDGYPSGAAGFIENWLESGKSWRMPRFEAADAAAAFIAANKKRGGGDVYLATPEETGGCQYLYVIFTKDEKLWIEVTRVFENKTIFTGTIADFIARADDLD
jgi:hypothetical protein